MNIGHRAPPAKHECTRNTPITAHPDPYLGPEQENYIILSSETFPKCHIPSILPCV